MSEVNANQLKNNESHIESLSDTRVSSEIIQLKKATTNEEDRQYYSTVLKESSASESLGNQFDVWLSYSPPNLKALAESKDSQSDETISLGKAWDNAYVIAEDSLDKKLKNLLGDQLQSFEARDIELTAFEPNVILELTTDEKDESTSSEKNGNILSEGRGNSPAQLEIIKTASDVWGSGEPNWHFSDEYSQLDFARGTLDKNIDNDKRVLIAHLDTGYNSKDATLLVNKDGSENWQYGLFSMKDSKGFTHKKCKNHDQTTLKPGECPSHGTKTLSVLAGKDYMFYVKGSSKLYSGIIGANPYANVFEYRISDSVIHFSTKAMTEAINTAVNKKADIISLSAGGFPSRAQRDAVNYAYDNGTAIFAATGDFFKIPFLGIQSPSLVAFPARYSTVMAVAGTTYDYRSYSEDPYSAWIGLFKNGFDLEKWASWMMRGNFGPRHIMARNKAVSGYAPNILKSEPPKKPSDSTINNQATLDGAGTSYAVPQAAGAASIWLQQERAEIVKHGLWDKWQKTEAVYQAVSVCSADKNTRPESMNDKKFQEHFGAGHLKAVQALYYHFPENIAKLGRKRPEATIGHAWIYDLILSMTPVVLPLEKLHASMMLLEILQFSSINKELADAKYMLEKCLFEDPDNTASSCKEQAAKFLTNVGKYPEISEKLRGTLDKLLSSNDRLSEIDKYLKIQLEAFRQAMKDSDPNSCRLDFKSILTLNNI